MKRVGKRLGDTLIEVTIAIGIFSMVAVAVVSVVSSSTSGAQAALETTVTREEIDTQAEAIRFIHSAYINDTSESNSYAKVWKEMVKKTTEVNDAYAPSTCASIYEKPNESELKNAFIIDYRALSTGDKSQIIKRPDGTSFFAQPATYPRLVYHNSGSLLDYDTFDDTYSLSKAEGIYVIVARDNGSTTIAEGDNTKTGSAYYDFYIRSCWYASNNDVPSTISTVIRLYDPDTVPEESESRGKTASWGITFHSGDTKVAKACADGPQFNLATKEQTTWPDKDNAAITAGSSGQLIANPFTRPGYSFKGWCSVEPKYSTKPAECTGVTYEDKAKNFEIPLSLDSGGRVHLYALWELNPIHTVKYNSNGATHKKSGGKYVILKGEETKSVDYRGGCPVKVSSNTWWKKTGHSFDKWNTSNNGSGASYTGGDEYTAPNDGSTRKLYAIWQPRYYSISFDGNGADGGSTQGLINILAGNAVQLTANGFTKSGDKNGYYSYVFDGWKCITNCSYIVDPKNATKYTNQQTVTTDEAGSGHIIMQAQWKKVEYYIVKYHANTGTGVEYQQKEEINKYVTVKGNSFTPPTGKTFAGWCRGVAVSGSTQKDCENAKNKDGRNGVYVGVQPGNSFTSSTSGAVNLYAMWKNACSPSTTNFDKDGFLEIKEGCDGWYHMQVWGGKGGSSYGSKGGWAQGWKQLKAGDKLYVYVGGNGNNGSAGHNGGGAGGSSETGAGGGATHIALNLEKTKLSDYKDNKSSVLIVAGGGGGGTNIPSSNCSSGSPSIKTWPNIVGYFQFDGGNRNGASYGGYGGGGNGYNPYNKDTRNTKVSSGCSDAGTGGDDCMEVWISNAKGGGSSSGGTGGIGTDHCGSSKHLNGNYDCGGSPGKYTSYHGNKGEFGQGGQGGYQTGLSQGTFGFSNAGGGGGWYGGGAGGLTTCRASSGAGGSNYTGNVTTKDGSGKGDWKGDDGNAKDSGYATIKGPY